MGIEQRTIEAAMLSDAGTAEPGIASTKIYSLPNCGIEPWMADDLDLPVDDIFARNITVPRKIAVCVDVALESDVDNVAMELQIPATLAKTIRRARIDRNQRKQAYYAAYRLPILPPRHKAVLVSAGTRRPRDRRGHAATQAMLLVGAEHVAFDDALNVLQAEFEIPREMRAAIARHIVDLAKHGESDVTRLRQSGIGVAKCNFRTTDELKPLS
jgi:hypothetical protein